MRADEGEYGEPGSSPVRRRALTHWALWSTPRRVVAFVLAIDAVTVGFVLFDLVQARITGDDLIAAAILVTLGALHTEASVGVERVRRRATDTPHVDLTSIWTLAAAVLLPPILFVIVAVIVFSHLWWRAWRPRVPLYRHVFSTATVVLACHAAAALVTHLGGGALADVFGSRRELFALVLAIAAYAAVSSALIAAAIAVNQTAGNSPAGAHDASASPGAPPSATLTASRLLGHWDDNLLELATLCLGGLTAVALTSNPWQVLLVVPPLLVLHRAVQVRQLEQVAATDSKTGLLNAAAWHAQAERELRRAARTRSAAGVIILDLDHFKSVNDDHGHLAGDEVLSAVATTLRTEVRENDLVGRFGGEEFIVLLPGLGREHSGPAGLHAIAERIRQRIATLTVVVDTPTGPLTIADLSASVGGASYPADGTTLQEVILASDGALYEAKHDGRNAVRITAPDAQRLPALHSGWTPIPQQQTAERLPTALFSRRRW